ncbi:MULTISPECIES: DUF3147 family protein [unclassified Marinobacterium]|uniref:DUF3147 family protein n=1 Tax=unclassified Marinobacterium TaxID=2644139 RepID=UPI00156A716A|nr:MULTISPECIES: DUF3147 family protein [unclassified Marinobacterium]NRP58055.1 hypothetical protein [Marinobacterium sp. xm-d-510]NRP98286.1 hypothetical protein [Marinobacterium sp. xm-a-127]
MAYYLVKVLVSSILILLVSEIAKRSSVFGAVIASVPLISVIAMIWLYMDTGDIQKVRDLAASIVWLVIPSLILFIVMPIMIDKGFSFQVSLFAGLGAMIASYGLTLVILNMVRV